MMCAECSSVAQQAVYNAYISHISIPLGIIIGLLASCIQSLGLTIQRKSHVVNQSLPQHERRIEHRRPLWLLGFLIFISSNVIGSVVQIASLPVVILAPLGAVSLLWNAFFARIILGDIFTPWMILSTLFIAGGAVLIAEFGIVPEPTRSLEDLLRLFNRPVFIVYFSILGAVVCVCLVVTHIIDFTFSRKLIRLESRVIKQTRSTQSLDTAHGIECTTERRTERTPLLDGKYKEPLSVLPWQGKVDVAELANIDRTRILLAVSYASFSGIISGMCLLFAKSGVELLLLTFNGDNQFWRWQAWALVGGLVVFALLQLWYLNKGLVLADPTIVCPSAFCLYNVSSIVNGLVYFDQFSLLPLSRLLLVGLGMSILLGGVWIVSRQPVSTEKREVINGREEEEEEEVLGESEEEHDAGETGAEANGSTSLEHLRWSTVGGASWSPRRYTETSPPLLPINTLERGFQIGLSPLSPGFSIQPRRRFSGLQTEERRRRTVSEGDIGQRRVGNEDSEDLVATGRGKGKRRDERQRWDWMASLM